MGAYLPLFSIEVEHMFFSQGLCLGLDFVPTPQSDAALKKAGLLTRTMINGIRVFYDEANFESLQLYAADPDEPWNLGFKVFSRDPWFENYMELSAHDEDAILSFDNRGAKIDTTGKLRLHDQEYVSEADSKRLTSPLFEKILSKKDRLVRPRFMINICISTKNSTFFDEQLNITPKNYYLKFETRKTFWKYYLLGDLAREDSYIADLDNETEFDFVSQETLPDNRIAVTFRSKTAIPLREKPDCRFQLREGGSGNGKVLIRRLPVASANQINRDLIDDAIVSEMFVNY